MALTPNEQRLYRFGSSQIYKRTAEDTVLEQLALQAGASAGGQSADASYTPLFKLWNYANILLASEDFTEVHNGNTVEVTSDGPYPVIDVASIAGTPSSYFYFANQFFSCDHMVIECDLRISGVNGTYLKKVGLGIVSKQSNELHVSAYQYFPAAGNATLRIEKEGTIVTSETPVAAPGVGNNITLRLEKTGSLIRFSCIQNSALNGTLVYNQTNMYGFPDNPSRNSDVLRNQVPQGIPCLVLAGATFQIKRFEVWTNCPRRADISFLGDENLLGYRIPFASNVQSKVSSILSAVNYSFASATIANLTSVCNDILALQPRSIVLWTGLYDTIANGGTIPASFNNNYRSLIKKISRFGVLPIRVKLPPVSLVSSANVNELNHHVMDGMGDYPVLDLWNSALSTNPSMPATNTPNPAYFEADGYHLNALGHEYVAAKILNEISNWDIYRSRIVGLPD